MRIGALVEGASDAVITKTIGVWITGPHECPDGQWVWWCGRCGQGERGELQSVGPALVALVRADHAACLEELRRQVFEP